ncbi:MAG TPA: alanine racemase [Candidatus Saccharimonadales bacterium]|nr:alanine racemase [Candidatus Saccharimonadales bacterium]
MSVPLRTTVADIDLDAIVANVEALAAASRVRVIAVVKADAYGHGAEAVSQVAIEAGAAALAVATVEEGLVLRRSGISAPILVLLGAQSADEIAAAVEAGLSLTVWSVLAAKRIAAAGRAAGRPAAVQLKVDTGLTRLGAPVDQAVERYRAIATLAGLAVEGVFTHLASADEADTTSARQQLDRFEGVLDGIGTLPDWVHASASAGTAAFDQGSRITAIRPGLALYGLSPAPHLRSRIPLRPALSWRSRIHRIAEVPAGTGVSYGHEYRTTADARIATVPIGYGDGIPRAAKGRLGLLIGGARVPIVGRISMDHVTLDVTGAPSLAEGDEAVVIGAQGASAQTAEDVATALDTISYEIVTGIRARVPRRYLRGGKVVAVKTLAEGFDWC